MPSQERKLLTMLDKGAFVCYIITMKRRRNKKTHPRVRVSPEGLMNSATREHRVRKGKGSFRRRKKYQKKLDRGF